MPFFGELPIGRTNVSSGVSKTTTPSGNGFESLAKPSVQPTTADHIAKIDGHAALIPQPYGGEINAKLQALQIAGKIFPQAQGYVKKLQMLQKSGALPSGPMPKSGKISTVSSGFAKKVRRLQDAQRALHGPATEKEQRSAAVIQKWFRKTRTADEMVNYGLVFWKSKLVKATAGITKASDFTHKNFDNLLRSVSRPSGIDGPIEHLSPEESAFAEHALKSQLYGTHFTNAPVVKKNGDLQLFSRKELERKGIDFPSDHTADVDIEELGNDGNVFFAMEPGDVPKKTDSQFGKILHRAPLDHPAFAKSTGLLHDPLVPRPGRRKLERRLGQLSSGQTPGFFMNKKIVFLLPKFDEARIRERIAESKTMIEHLPEGTERDDWKAMLAVDEQSLKDVQLEPNRMRDLTSLADRKMAGLTECEFGDPHALNQAFALYDGNQIKPALVFSTIRDSRELSPDGKSALLSARSDDDLNHVFNGLYRPQIQVPTSFDAPKGTFQTFSPDPSHLDNGLQAMEVQHDLHGPQPEQHTQQLMPLVGDTPMHDNNGSLLNLPHDPMDMS